MGCLWFVIHGPVSGSDFDAERRALFDELSSLLTTLPFRSVWVFGGDFNAEIGSRDVGEEWGFRCLKL